MQALTLRWLQLENSIVSAPYLHQQFIQRVFDFFFVEELPQAHSSGMNTKPSNSKPNTKRPTDVLGLKPESSHTRQIVLQGQNISYTLFRTRRKTIGMQVSAGHLKVSAPKWVSLVQIQQALEEKGAWILKQIEHTQEKAKALRAQDVKVEHGCVMPWLGTKLQVHFLSDACALQNMGLKWDFSGDLKVGTKRLEPCVAHAYLERHQGNGIWTRCSVTEALDRESSSPLSARLEELSYKMYLPMPKGVATHLALQVFKAVLKAQARDCFESRLRYFSARFGVAYQQLKLSQAQTRWGSASEGGVIHLNWHLLHFSPELIDYVVAHELCHLIHMNHSEQFWTCLNQVLPDSESRRRKLHRMSAPGLFSVAGELT